MSYTNLYWAPDKYSTTRTFTPPISGHLGIDFEMIPDDPVTAGYFFNQNQPLPGISNRMTNSYMPEYFTAGSGKVPTVGGAPRMDQSVFKFSRTYQ